MAVSVSDFIFSLIFLSVLQGMRFEGCKDYRNSGIAKDCEELEIKGGDVCYTYQPGFLFYKWLAKIKCQEGFYINGSPTRECSWTGLTFNRKWSWDKNQTKCASENSNGESGTGTVGLFVAVPLVILTTIGVALVLAYIYRKRRKEAMSTPNTQNRTEMTVNNIMYNVTEDTVEINQAAANLESNVRSGDGIDPSEQCAAAAEYSTIDSRGEDRLGDNLHSHINSCSSANDITIDINQDNASGDDYSHLNCATDFKNHPGTDTFIENVYSHPEGDAERKDTLYDCAKTEKATACAGSVYDKLKINEDYSNGLYDHTKSSNIASETAQFSNRALDYGQLNENNQSNFVGADGYYEHIGVVTEAHETDNVYNKLQGDEERISNSDGDETEFDHADFKDVKIAQIELDTYAHINNDIEKGMDKN